MFSFTYRSYASLLARQLSQILELVTEIKDVEDIRPEILGLVTAALCSSSSDLSVSMGAGRRAIEHIWNSDDLLAVNVTGSLRELEWKCFGQFALPPFLKGCTRILSDQQDAAAAGGKDMLKVQTLRVLARIAGAVLLENADRTVQQALTAWTEHFFNSFQLSAESVRSCSFMVIRTIYITARSSCYQNFPI